jgi:NADPH2:quinone reductase
VDVVLEMTGGPVFDASLRALAPFGRLVTYGMASRTAADPGRPAQPDGPLDRGGRLLAGALLPRPGPLAGRPDDRAAGHGRGRAAARVVGGTYPLGEAAEAHRALLERRSTGKLVLDPRR